MKKGFVLTLAALGLAGLMLFAGIGIWIWKVDTKWSPLIEPRLRERQNIGSIRILATSPDGHDQWIGSLTSGRTEERQPLKLAEIPPLLIQSIVTLEDPRFLEHGGFDVLGILRAMAHNLITFRYSQGGSTLTQQLVKNVFLTREKTLSRKLTELVLSALVEKRFTKDEILEAYINEVYMGQLGSMEIHGMGRASEFYFSKKLDQLEVHELALLAAMVAGPGYYSPWKHPVRTKARRDRVLRTLAEAKMILPQELDSGLKQPLPGPSTFIAPTRSAYLLDALREDIVNTRPEEEIVRGGFDIKLGLDMDLQERVERALLAKSSQWGPHVQGLVVAADPRTCTIRAYAGGTDYRVTQLDRVRQSRRPIGSLMKPLELARLLEEDNTLNLATVIDDQPLKWSYDNGRGSWSPANFDLKFRGKTTLRHALEESINVPVARIFFDRQPSGLLSEMLDPVRALGLEIPPERALPSAVLGAIDQTPRQTLTAFLRLTRQALGLAQNAGDFACRLSFEAATPYATNATPPIPNAATPASTTAAFGQKGARIVLTALEGALRRGTGHAFGSQIPVTQPWASKTGTSSDKRDSWYVAISPDLVILTWVGRDDNHETNFTGATGALPLTQDIMSAKFTMSTTPAWNWPVVPQTKWLAVRMPEYCLPSDITAGNIKAQFPEPASGTPPPQPFDFEGHQYVYEFFREGAVPPSCP